MKYQDYIVEDFVLDKSFRNYILKKNKTDEDFWEEWIREHPDKKELIREAGTIIRSIHFKEFKVTKEEIDKGFDEIERYFDEKTPGKVRSLFSGRAAKWAAAVIAVLLIGSGVLYYTNQNNALDNRQIDEKTRVLTENQEINTQKSEKAAKTEPSTAKETEKEKQTKKKILEKEIIQQTDTQGSEKSGSAVRIDPLGIQYATNNTRKQKIKLPDGSVAYMNTNTKLTFNEDWRKEKQRIVELRGEAYFNVKERTLNGKNIGFRVKTANVTVKVTGTKFDVKNREKETKVFLDEGRVNMSIRGKGQVIQMTPGDMIAYNASTGNLTSFNKKKTDLTSWLSAFDETERRTSIPENMISSDVQNYNGDPNNKAEIIQSGNENIAYIDQIGKNLESKQIQQGKGNQAQATFKGKNTKDKKDNASWSTLQIQEGNANVSIFTLMDSYNSNIYSVQKGRENKALVKSKGLENEGLIMQYGGENEVRLMQQGAENKALIIQKGSPGETGLGSSLFDNLMEGRYNKVNVIQRGFNHQVKSIQKGQNNRSNINQKN